MRALSAIAVVAILSAATPALAQNATPPANTQQERMKTCNTEAGAQKLKGQARQTFMSDCLSGKTTSGSSAMSPQDKMKACNAQASTQQLTGNARKSFMSSCLKGS